MGKILAEGELPSFRHFQQSAQGAPVDAILDGIPFRIIASATALTRQLK